jgi:acyl-CoA thioester hydrolase
MPRIKIAIPTEATHLYRTTIPVLISHINYGNHLGSDGLISILHEARLRFIKNCGMCDEKSLDGNTGLIVTSLAITHYREVLHGEYLDVDIFVANITKKTCDLIYKFTSSSNTGDNVVAMASTSLLFVDAKSRRSVAMPQNFLCAITGRNSL